MIGVYRPVSNTERHRQFRERNPGYYGRLHRRRKEEVRAYGEARRAAEAMVSLTFKPVLMLPAPVEVIAIPGINAIPAVREAIPTREPLPICRD